MSTQPTKTATSSAKSRSICRKGRDISQQTGARRFCRALRFYLACPYSILFRQGADSSRAAILIQRQIIIEGKGFSLSPESHAALQANYSIVPMMYGCKILSVSSNMIIVESQERLQKRSMRESAIGLIEQIVICLNDLHNRRLQTVHGSRFTVKFVKHPK